MWCIGFFSSYSCINQNHLSVSFFSAQTMGALEGCYFNFSWQLISCFVALYFKYCSFFVIWNTGFTTLRSAFFLWGRSGFHWEQPWEMGSQVTVYFPLLVSSAAIAVRTLGAVALLLVTYRKLFLNLALRHGCLHLYSWRWSFWLYSCTELN